MTQTTAYSILFMAMGIFPIIAGIANLDFFFNHRKAQFFLKVFGRLGARIFYIVLGAAIFTLGVLGLAGIISLENAKL